MPVVREFKESDLEQIQELHKKFHAQGFNMPSIAEAYADAVVVHDDKILGFGMLRDITESIMILDLDLSIRLKKETLTKLIQESIMRARNTTIHSFVENESFGNVLKKHYGYKNCKGSALCLEL